MGKRDDEETVTRGDRERASNRLWRFIFWVVLVVGVTIAGLTTNDAKAGVRCGQDLIDTGDSMNSVLEACGEPERRARLVDDYGDTIGIVLYIDPGYGKDTRRLEIRSGRVSLIERLD